MRIIVFGAGRVGAAIARDLAADQSFDVTVADIDENALRRLRGVERLTTVRADLRTVEMVRRLAGAHDLVVGAVPGPMGYGMVHSAIGAGRDIVDISFFEEDPYPELDELARRHGVMVLTDCGIAPGFSNLVLGTALTELDSVESFECLVGGLPEHREPPFEYKAVFSPIDVIAEYTRPARLVENGKIVVREALSGVEEVEFEGVGRLEAFNTDGLRTLLRLDIADMKEKTLRYPGHAAKIRLLRDAGFFSPEAMDFQGHEISPLEMTTRVLFPIWQLKEGEADLTVMRMEVQGLRDGRKVLRKYELIDRYDRRSGTTSMARTTGYTCTAIVRLVARGDFRREGVYAPEVIGGCAGCFEAVLGDLEERGIKVEREELVETD